jgi:AcrR family transcriptional regulator
MVAVAPSARADRPAPLPSAHGGHDHRPVESAWDRRKRITRRQLRDAAVELVAQRGLQAVTVEEIATAAGVSTRTFFNYFPGKEDAVVGWDPDRTAAVEAALASQPADVTPFDALRCALLEVLGDEDDAADLLRRLRVTTADPHLLARQVERFGEIERRLVDALTRRRGTADGTDGYAALVVATVLAACRVALLTWSTDPVHRPLATVMSEHLDLLGAGLSGPAPTPKSRRRTAGSRRPATPTATKRRCP